jgi:hypothetical protein
MAWTLVKEEKETSGLKISGNSFVLVKIEPPSNPPSTDADIIFSYWVRTYNSETSMEIPEFGKANNLIARVVASNKSSSRWYLSHLSAHQAESYTPLLSRNGNRGIAMFVTMLREAKTQYTSWSMSNQMPILYPTMNSQEIKSQAKNALGELSKFIDGQNDLQEIICNGLLA